MLAKGVRKTCLLLSLTIGCTPLALGDEAPAGREVRDGERIVLLGGTLIEREQQSGYWELLLTMSNPDRRMSVRNLGWSGDTVWGESRGMFEPQLGYQRLLEQVQAANPTLLIIAYGNNEAFAGPAGLDRFVAQYRKLLSDLTSDGRRWMLLSPLLMETDRLPHSLDASAGFAMQYNHHVDLYAEAVRSLAVELSHGFIDLRNPQREYLSGRNPPLTTNGLHLNENGYRQTAQWVAGGLTSASVVANRDWDADFATRLRTAIVAKNELYFHRWRPQNFTYLLGFRDYEQGQNAAEIPKFDLLIEAAEAHITDLAHSQGAGESKKSPDR